MQSTKISRLCMPADIAHKNSISDTSPHLSLIWAIMAVVAVGPMRACQLGWEPQQQLPGQLHSKTDCA